MICARSVDDFDRQVNTILVREFRQLLELGLLSEDSLLPVVEGMRSSLREAFPAMSTEEVEFHLRHLQNQCRDIAYRIFNLAYTTYWN